MHAQFRYPIAHGIDIAQQASLETLDSCNNDATNRFILESVDPFREFGEYKDGKHDIKVIDRLQKVNTEGYRLPGVAGVYNGYANAGEWTCITRNRIHSRE